MKKAAIILLLILAIATLPMTPVNAVSFSMAGECNQEQNSNVKSVNCTLLNNGSGGGGGSHTVTQGDLLVSVLALNGPSINTPTDTLGTTWATQCYAPYALESACVAYGTAHSSGIDNLGWTWSPNGVGVMIFIDITNAGQTVVCISEGQSSTGQSYSTLGSCDIASTDIAISGIAAGGATIFTAGAGFNCVDGYQGSFNCATQSGNPIIVVQACGGTQVNKPDCSGASPSTNFPGSGNANSNWVDVGIKVGLGSVVIPCTWFQQQCWWYPSLFFGLYLGLFAVVARKAEIEGRALTYMMLSGLNMAAIAQTAMGLLTPVLPLLLITLTVVYVVRFRNR